MTDPALTADDRPRPTVADGKKLYSDKRKRATSKPTVAAGEELYRKQPPRSGVDFTGGDRRGTTFGDDQL